MTLIGLHDGTHNADGHDDGGQEDGKDLSKCSAKQACCGAGGAAGELLLDAVPVLGLTAADFSGGRADPTGVRVGESGLDVAGYRDQGEGGSLVPDFRS